MIVRLIQRHDFRAWLADGRAVRFERDPALRRQAQLARLPRLLEILRGARHGCELHAVQARQPDVS